MKIIPLFLAALLALIAPARADKAADLKLVVQLEAAIEKGDVEAAKPLVAAPNFSPLLRTNDQHQTPLNTALRLDQPRIARLMMQSAGWKKVKWDARNTALPLVLASSPANFSTLRDLARLPGADLNTPAAPGCEFPLNIAANMGNLEALRWLVKQPGINFKRRTDAGQTALYDASPEATEFLLSLRRFDINARDQYGQTALHNAAGLRQVDKVRMLLDAPGINPNLRDRNRVPRTALDVALMHNSVAVAQELISSKKVRTTPAQRALLRRMGG